MKKKEWPGNNICSFCKQEETAQHLFFSCSIARVVWRAVGSVFGTEYRPNNIWQFYSWCYAFFRTGEMFYMVGLPAICWASWLARNKATFENKMIRSPFEIVFAAYSLLMYWAGLQKGNSVKEMRAGAELLKINAANMLRLRQGSIQGISC